MPKRINRCIELLEQGENLYYTGTGPLTYENGLKQAKTWADFLITDFEHYPFNTQGLREFMQGLVDGGPTNAGHRTPAVISTLPSNCRTIEEVRANAWQIRQVLSAGVHGILHTHARQAEAVRVAKCDGLDEQGVPTRFERCVDDVDLRPAIALSVLAERVLTGRDRVLVPAAADRRGSHSEVAVHHPVGVDDADLLARQVQVGDHAF